MIVFLVGLGVGLAIGFVVGGVWQAVQELKWERKLHGRWSHHGERGPYDGEEDR